MGDDKIKIVIFADNTTFYLRGISSLNKMQVIVKLYVDVSTSKWNFSKNQTLIARNDAIFH